MKRIDKIIGSFIILFLIALFSFSCNQPVEFNNPLDPEIPLNSPSDLRLISMTETTLELQWKENVIYTKEEQARSVEIIVEQSLDGNNYSDIASFSATLLTGTITKIFLANQMHYFRVHTKVESKISASSNIVSGIILLRAPTRLAITSMTNTEVKLNWVDNSNNETGFNIEMGTDGTNFNNILIVDSNRTEASIVREFNSISLYYFRVYSNTLVNKSAYSNIVNESVKGISLTGIEFIYINGGEFLMGSPNGTGYEDEHPQHSVKVGNYYIGKYEVVQVQWREVVVWKQRHGGTLLSASPSNFSGDSLPVEQVNWNQVCTWIEYLNKKEGTDVYRLPTEAEWEFAARGGNESKGYTFSGSNDIYAVAWMNDYSMSIHSPYNVGLKAPNELGIYDLTGNVLEWCNDWYGPYLNSTQINPTGPDDGQLKILRGGGWGYYIHDCRITARHKYEPYSSSDYGFRLAKKIK